MDKSGSYITQLLLSIILIVLIWSHIESRNDGSIKEWQYKQLVISAELPNGVIFLDKEAIESTKSIPNIEEKINELGLVGWELVGFYLEQETTHPNYGNDDYVTGIQPNIRPSRLTLIFKRSVSL